VQKHVCLPQLLKGTEAMWGRDKHFVSTQHLMTLIQDVGRVQKIYSSTSLINSRYNMNQASVSDLTF
jgi:hypothetical protein